MGPENIIHNGRERIVMDLDDYEGMVDARDAAIAMRDIAAGAPALSPAETDAYLAAATPLAFWRKRAGKTQAALAAEVGLSQALLAQIEGGAREGNVGVLARIARGVRVRLDDLVEE
jgi:DNA-binding XRE family transcriptional regulator